MQSLLCIIHHESSESLYRDIYMHKTWDLWKEKCCKLRLKVTVGAVGGPWCQLLISHISFSSYFSRLVVGVSIHYRTSIIQDIHDEANSSWEFFGLKRDADVITRAPCSYTSCCSLHKSNSNPIKGALLVLWSACQGIQVYTARCATSVLKAVGIEKLMSKILEGTPTVRPATTAF